jgi:phosphoadenylyl-sulfate reductase (thioredoxin)
MGTTLLDTQSLVEWAVRSFGREFAVVTSFQREGMVILDMAAKTGEPFRVLTIDTGRLPAATREMIGIVERRYGVVVDVIAPDPLEVESMVRQHGRDLFRRDVSFRRLCCHIRKVRPLERELRNLRAWAVGLRRSQSPGREDVKSVELVDKSYKLSPVADWSAEDVIEYVRANAVPEHPLYAEGYATIGCDPCTRALNPEEPERAGRWWWESDADKECGLHFTPEGRSARAVDILVREVLAASDA